MIGRTPHEIWQSSLEDGQVRLDRSSHVLAATSLLGGFHVMLGLTALVMMEGALSAVLPEPSAHVLASLVFGIGFVFLTIGRSELFTENFLIPVATVMAGRSTVLKLLRLWGVSFALNAVGLLLFAWILTREGVIVADEALTAAGSLADTLADRSVLAALLSAVVAGAVMTTFTWLAEAAESDVTRVLVALLVGFVLLAPSLNHCVLAFGEITFGILAGTAEADVIDLLRNTGLAAVGNIVGGVGFVAFTRMVQAREAKAVVGD